MKTTELKVAIAAKVIEIKALKKILSEPHVMPGSLHDMYQLWKLGKEIRAMYLVYGWFRGNSANQIEQKPIDMCDVGYEIGKILLEPEKVDLFKNWLDDTRLKKAA